MTAKNTRVGGVIAGGISLRIAQIQFVSIVRDWDTWLILVLMLNSAAFVSRLHIAPVIVLTPGIANLLPHHLPPVTPPGSTGTTAATRPPRTAAATGTIRTTGAARPVKVW